MMSRNYMSLWGSPDKHSYGMAMLYSKEEVRKGYDNGSLMVDDVGNGKAVILRRSDRHWFLGNAFAKHSYTILLGAVCGDVAGSVYEHNNIMHFPDKSDMIKPRARVTDDSVLTMAVAEGIRQALDELGESWMENPDHRAVISRSITNALQLFGRKYPHAGYGASFRNWIYSTDPKPYNSWGNGSAMRVSFAGWAGRTLEEAETLAELSAAVTHNHPEGIKGAKVVAGIIHLLRSGKTKADVRRYAQQYYDLDFTIEQIRDNYRFDVSCQGSVPQAIVAFLEGEDFVDVMARAIWLGGDSDTIAAIACSMAEVVYPVPRSVLDPVIDRLDPFQKNVLEQSIDWAAAWNHFGA